MPKLRRTTPSTSVRLLHFHALLLTASLCTSLADYEPTTPPISASSPGKLPPSQATQLTTALLSRPSIDYLADQGILRAPTELTGDKLAKQLSTRPPPDAVKGIVKSPVQAKQEEITRRSLLSSLSGALDRRPSIEDVMARGYVQAPGGMYSDASDYY